ncbi:MAG: peptidoglycan-binding domain-containing protein [Chthoniobacterales bacterium]
MKIKIALAIFLAATAIARGDDTVAQAQQALKIHGFYYGEVTGQKNADTTAAVRRFQIRNGLQVTGELNSETMRALVSGNPNPAPTAAAPSATPYLAAKPSPEDEEEDLAEPSQGAPPDRSAEGRIRGGDQVYPPNPAYPSSPAIMPPGGGLFAGTPYETAPAPVQRDLIASAQSVLARQDLYRGEIDGAFGPNTEFSIRAYQARTGLPVTGRLDLETLAALNLLPGPDRQFFGPRRRTPPRFEPPVRGEWIH